MLYRDGVQGESGASPSGQSRRIASPARDEFRRLVFLRPKVNSEMSGLLDDAQKTYARGLHIVSTPTGVLVMFMFFAQALSATPEPGTLVIWSLLAATLAVFGWWRTKRR
jgi:hypothetical protein